MVISVNQSTYKLDVYLCRYPHSISIKSHFTLPLNEMIDCSQLAWLCTALHPSLASTLHTEFASLTFCQPFGCQDTDWHLMIFQHGNVTFITLYHLSQTWIQMQTWNGDWLLPKLWHTFKLTSINRAWQDTWKRK